MEEVAYQRFSRDLILIPSSAQTANKDNRMPVRDKEDGQVLIEYPTPERERDHELQITNKAQLTAGSSKVTYTEYNKF